MKKKDALGQFEQLVLTAVLLCRENAYGIPVHQKVEQLGERPVKPPSVYITLGRLEEKGYLRSRFADPTPQRGGKRKRYFRVLAAGNCQKAIQAENDTRGTIHLLLSDVRMPDMSGPVIAQILKKHRPDMRVMLMSGYPDGEIVPLLRAVNTAFDPATIHEATTLEYKEFKTGRRHPWAEDRVM